MLSMYNSISRAYHRYLQLIILLYTLSELLDLKLLVCTISHLSCEELGQTCVLTIVQDSCDA